MQSSSKAFNPYQPPPAENRSDRFADDGTVRFYTTDANLRFAESHFVLRLHPMRLIVVSLLLIAASSIVMIFSIFFGTLVFGITSAAAMAISATIYLASVYRTKSKLRDQWSKHGLQSGTVSSVAIEQSELVLASPAGIYRWPIDSVKTYRTRKGLMVSPEPLLCLFVPKNNESSPQALDEVRRALGK